MFLPNPGVLAAGTQERTYAEFVAHITALADDVVGWEADLVSEGAFVTQAAYSGPFGSMNGSSWGPSSPSGWAAALNNAASRVVQHGLASKKDFDEQRIGGQWIFLRVVFISGAAKPSVARNGYTSIARGSVQGRACTDLLYWHEGRAWKMQPHLGLGPEPYDW